MCGWFAPAALEEKKAFVSFGPQKKENSRDIDDLRIEKDQFRELNTIEMISWLPVCPKRKSIQFIIEILEMIS